MAKTTTKKKTTKKKAAKTATAPKAGRNLVIVESPAKAKTINKYLGNDYIVKASMGHVRDLPDRDIGVNLEDNFAPTYTVVPGRKKVISELVKLAEGAPLVYFATDLDREGEAIAWHLREVLGTPEDRVRRVIFNEITKSAIHQAFDNAHHEIDHDRVDAQQARRVLDRIVGYQLSPLLWRKVAKNLSAGRVQSVAVRVIAEREQEIRAFIPEESWRVNGCFALDLKGAAALQSEWKAFLATGDEPPTQKARMEWLGERSAFQAELVKWIGKDFKPESAEPTREAVTSLGFVCEGIEEEVWEEYAHHGLKKRKLIGSTALPNPTKFSVKSRQTKRTQSRPPGPFTTATLQQAGANQLRFATSRTMRIAQQLYEGVDIGGADGQVALITYMRTDSTNISKEALTVVRDHIGKEYGDKYLPPKPNFFGKAQRAQEAHEAIRPTDVRFTPDALKGHLNAEQLKLYTLIWKRFVACQMTPTQWDSTTVEVAADTDNGEAIFRASGRVLVFDGFLQVTGSSGGGSPILPEMAEGQQLANIEIDPAQQFTTPPARYTEASLVKTLEAEGIGRPSTYAAIIKTIQDRGYVEQTDRKFFATALGEIVTEKLVNHFPQIMDVKFTSHMEDQLDKIEEAHLDWVAVLNEFYEPFKDLLSRASTEMEPAKAEPSDEKCPECEKEMVYRWSKTGRFLSCTGYPECKVTFNVGRDGKPQFPKETDHSCKLCGKPLTLRQSRNGPFLGCSGYPECTQTLPCDEGGNPLETVKEEDLKDTCDLCGGEMNVKWRGRSAFLGCKNYPKCKNTKPVSKDIHVERKPAPPPEEAGVSCEQCNRPMVIRSGRRGKFIACSGYPRCRNTKPVEKLDELKAEAKKNGTVPGPLGDNGKDAAGKKGGKTDKGAASKTKEDQSPPPGFAWTRTGRLVVEDWPGDKPLICPECGNELILKAGRWGPFYSCTGYPRCKVSCNLRGDAKKIAAEEIPAPPPKPKPVPTDIDCPECGNKLLLREGRSGKFLGCSGYPKCRHTDEVPADMPIPAPSPATS
jgi:DNA topoisomerase-1